MARREYGGQTAPLCHTDQLRDMRAVAGEIIETVDPERHSSLLARLGVMMHDYHSHDPRNRDPRWVARLCDHMVNSALLGLSADPNEPVIVIDFV